MKRSYVKALMSAMMLSAVLFCGCSPDTDNRTEETDSSEIVNYFVNDENETRETDNSADSTKIIAELDMYTSYIQLCFEGNDNGYDYKGTLSLRVYKPDNKYEPASTFVIYENKTFQLRSLSSDDVYLYELDSNKVLFTNPLSDGRHIRIFDISTDNFEVVPVKFSGYEDTLGDPYEIIGENFLYSANTEHAYYIYGNTAYTEFYYDSGSETMTVTGQLEYKSDPDLAYAASRSNYRLMFAYGELNFTDGSLYSYMTKTGEKDDTDIYRIDSDFLADRQELEEYIFSAFSENYTEKNREELEAAMFEDEMFGNTVFTEDSEGLIYNDCYRGVPNQPDFTTARVLSRSEDSAEVLVQGHSVDTSIYLIYHLVKENGV